jgi:adenylosuccinate lyase
VEILASLVERFADQIQIGRTHGQHALPITVGFWLATVLSRILYNAEQMDKYAKGLVGKISGAVGASNALVGLGIAERCGSKSFEERVLSKIGLKPARISTQILPPEPLAYFLYSCCMLTASIAQLGRDCRHLMRSEIGEVVEEFEAGQEGSSAMPHKRNPINFENLEGMFIRTKNEFGKVMDTLISEHQRDLVNSSVARDFPIIVVNLQQQLNTLLRKNKQGVPFLDRISIDPEACDKNFRMNAHVIMAEALKGALKMAGYRGDTYSLINKNLMPLASKEKMPLIEVFNAVADKDEELRAVRSHMPNEIVNLLHHPRSYIGNAKEKALEIASLARKQFRIK